MEKFNKIANIIVVALLFLVLVNTCTIRSSIRITAPVIETIENRLDSLANEQISTKELNLLLDKNGYEVSYRMLYDNNTVIRTTKRPDDIMKAYKDSIDLKNKQLLNVWLDKKQ